MKNTIGERILNRLNKAMVRRGMLKKFVINIHNQRITVPVMDGAYCRLTEPFLLDVLEIAIPQKSGAFIDVGVNLGQTLVKVKAIDAERRYIGFEPNPVCVHYSERLISYNQFTNCDIVPVGVSDRNGLAILNHYSPLRVDSSASIIPDFRSAEKIERRSIVPVAQFSQVSKLNLVGDVSFVKVDVEGAELEVLRSMKEVFIQHKPLIFIEVLPPYTSSNTQRIMRMKGIEEILSEVDYCIFRIEKDSHQAFVDLELLHQFDLYSDLSMSDFILAPIAEQEFWVDVFSAGPKTK